MFRRTKSYVVGYAHRNGFGRVFMATNRPISESVIMEWEAVIAGGNAKGEVSILSISKIDGPITPVES